MRDREDQIAGADIARTQRELYRIGPIGHTDRMLDADKICEGNFESLDLSTQDVEPTFEDPGDRGVYGSPLREVAGTRIGLGDLIREIFRSHAIIL
jgi:hypothetical protein